MIQLLLTIYAGFTHAFETDHLLAVSNIVTNRNRLMHAVKDGIYWGLGHASTIVLIGVLMIVMKKNIAADTFHYFEAVVGVMLISLAVYRVYKLYRQYRTTEIVVKNLHSVQHVHGHKLAYGIGLIHGLAGSGALVVLLMSQVNSTSEAITYLCVFGLGSVLGMLLAAGLFSTPFSKKLIQPGILQVSLVLLSSALCIAYGGKVIYQNLFA